MLSAAEWMLLHAAEADTDHPMQGAVRRIWAKDGAFTWEVTDEGRGVREAGCMIQDARRGRRETGR